MKFLALAVVIFARSVSAKFKWDGELSSWDSGSVASIDSMFYYDENDFPLPLRKGVKAPRRLALSEAVSHECAGEMYDLSIVVDGAHILLSAEPKCVGSLRNNECQECPALVFHSTLSLDKGGEQLMEKNIHEFELNENNERLVLGTFVLGTLVEAFVEAPVGASKQYNLFSNNCAGLPINMGLHLGIDPTDHKIISFVSRNLPKKVPSAIIDKTIIEKHGKEDTVVIEEFVSTYIHDRV